MLICPVVGIRCASKRGSSTVPKQTLFEKVNFGREELDGTRCESFLQDESVYRQSLGEDRLS